MTESLFDRSRSIQERFEEFHRDHPEVYDLIIQYARNAKAAGFDRFSISAIIERIRWFHHIEKGDREFMLDNRFRSRYARKLMDEHPEEFADFFEVRVLKSP